MKQERVIIGAGVIIGLLGAVTAITEGRNPWRSVGGAIGFTLLLGLLASAGEGPANVARGLAGIGVMTVVFYNAEPLFKLASGLSEDREAYHNRSSVRATNREAEDK